MPTHPLQPGAPVHHVNQQWARAATGIVLSVEGPDHRGAYEYTVQTVVDFSRPAGPDNLMVITTRWPSWAVVAVATEEPTP